MNKCYSQWLFTKQFHLPTKMLHKQFSRQYLCKGLVKGQKSQGRDLTKAHISSSIKLSTKLNLYSTLEPSFSANIRQQVRCVGKDKSTTKAHMSHLLQNDMTTTAWVWQLKLAGKPHSKYTNKSISCYVAYSRVQNVASESNDSKTSKGPNCLLNA